MDIGKATRRQIMAELRAMNVVFDEEATTIQLRNLYTAYANCHEQTETGRKDKQTDLVPVSIPQQPAAIRQQPTDVQQQPEVTQQEFYIQQPATTKHQPVATTQQSAAMSTIAQQPPSTIILETYEQQQMENQVVRDKGTQLEEEEVRLDQLIAIASRADVSEADLIDFIVEGINDETSYGAILFGATTMAELKLLVNRYERKRPSRQSLPVTDIESLYEDIDNNS